MSRTVLIVEDQVAANAALSRAFVRAGFSCISAHSYEQAAAIEPQSLLTACIVDIVLGDDETAGLRLISQLRTLPGRPPVIVITAFADVAKVKTALNEGASFLLEKPFRAPELIGLVEKLASSDGGFSALIDAALTRAGLTQKESVVARLILKGLTSREIALVESNSEKTIRYHLSVIFRKCGVSSRAELFRFVFQT